MNDKNSKTKEEILLDLYIADYITKTAYYEMQERIKKSK